MSWVYCEPKSRIRMPSWCWGTKEISSVVSSRESEATEGSCRGILGAKPARSLAFARDDNG
jgi:hypothetical protein